MAHSASTDISEHLLTSAARLGTGRAAAPPALRTLLIHEDETVKEALKKLDKTAEKTLIVVDPADGLLGTISDGDIRRHLLNGRGIDDPIGDVYHTRPIVLRENDWSPENAKELMLEHKIELLPVVNADNRVVSFLSWSQAFSERQSRTQTLDLPAVIMAGGRGTRLEPFTRVFPKPLIPIGDRPVIEVIIDELRHHGVRRFYLTVNYKAEMIEAYFKCLDRDYEITFVREDQYLGTAGALRLLRGQLDGNFILSNCDTVVKASFEDVVTLHRDQQSWITILSALRHYEIPYGVLKYGNGGEILELVEKPECTFTINTGCYVLDSRCLDLIPEGHFDMPDLVSTVIARNKKAITYPVNESDYIDIGQWEEYRRMLRHFETIA